MLGAKIDHEVGCSPRFYWSTWVSFENRFLKWMRCKLRQVNFVPCGSLRDLVIYPQSRDEMLAAGYSDDDVRTCLRWAHVSPTVIHDGRAQLEFNDGGHIVRPSLDDVRDWQKDLSPGQKQRLAFARLFYHRPSFVVLDECTNGISPDVEHDLYDRCTRLNLAVFSISHKIELKLFHVTWLAGPQQRF